MYIAGSWRITARARDIALERATPGDEASARRADGSRRHPTLARSRCRVRMQRRPRGRRRPPAAAVRWLVPDRRRPHVTPTTNERPYELLGRAHLSTATTPKLR